MKETDFPSWQTKGQKGPCVYCLAEFDPVKGQMVRKKDWRIVKGYCGATSFTIIPRRFWNPFNRRTKVRAGDLCSRKPNKNREYPYNPGDVIFPEMTPIEILAKHLTD